MKRLWNASLPAAVLAVSFLASGAEAADGAAPGTMQLVVRADQPGPRISPTLWGIFFEDINLGADGGLYAELVKNRGFEFPEPMMGWSQVARGGGSGRLGVEQQSPFHSGNPHYLRVRSEGAGAFGVSNEGFRGMGVLAGETYDFSAQVRVVDGSPEVRVALVDEQDRVLAEARLTDVAGAWKRVAARLKPSGSASKARLQVLVAGGGTADLDFVSLFPSKTWKNRPGGLRADMVQALADLRPGFLRFPGGCIVEGSDLSKRYQWKKTLGPIEGRSLLINRWNYEFKHRPTPDYYQSFGLGFYEYFQLCEDIGAAPLPILSCGLACQFNTGEACRMEDLQPFIQDALDLIEFANGAATTPWGSKRAEMGHPAPFHLTMIGIGNENWDAPYLERYALFHAAIKAQHPEIQLVSSAGPAPADEHFKYAWPRLKALRADIIDEHCYANPVWFLSSTHRFDRYDRKGPKVFFGEYAAQSYKIVSVENRNNWDCALAEAAYMTGLERNADVVRMASYAPLFAHIDGWQWTPNLIWTDNLRVMQTPSYYVQQLFMHHRGDVVLPVQLRGDAGPTEACGGIDLSSFQGKAEFRDVVVKAGGRTLYESMAVTPGGRWGDAAWRNYTLTLQARKVAGPEGFIIGFRYDQRNTRVQWNLGGWGNTKHGLQSLLGVQESIVAQVPGRIEADRWYDVRVELKGAKIRCFLDGRLVQAVEVPLPRAEGVFASAVRDERSGDVILKVANARATASEVAIQWRGVKSPAGPVRIVTLSAALDEVNTLGEPARVRPVETTEPGNGGVWERSFPAHSFTVLRWPTR